MIPFHKSSQFSSIIPIDRTLSGVNTTGQSGPGSDDNEGVFHIPQSCSITGTSPSDCLVSYPGNSFGCMCVSYPSAEIQSVYSTAPADWAKLFLLEMESTTWVETLNKAAFISLNTKCPPCIVFVYSVLDQSASSQHFSSRSKCSNCVLYEKYCRKNIYLPIPLHEQECDTRFIF